MSVNVSHIADGLFGDHHQFAWCRRRSRSKRTSGIHQLVVFNAPIHEADALGLGSINHLRENHRCKCCLSANDLPLHPRVTAAWMQSDLQEPCIESCSAGSDSEITPKREIHAGTNCRAIHGSNCWQRRSSNPQEALVNGSEALRRCSLKISEVGTCAKRRASTGHNHR